jgi:membrane protein DedA with SNARE-associated domain
MILSANTAQYVEWILQFKYPLLFPIAVIEGPIVTVIAGFLVSLSKINVLAAFLIIVTGDLVGDTLYYIFGRSGGRRLVKRWGDKFGVPIEKLERIENHFKKHPAKTLAIGKVAHGLGGFFLTAAGLAKMPYSRFLLYNFIPTVFKTFLLLLLGYYFGNAYSQISKYLDETALIILIFSFSVVTLYFIIPMIIKWRFRIKM